MSRTERDLFAWAGLSALVLLAALAGPFFVGRAYLRDDLGAFHLPTRAFYAAQLARGEPYDWMPQLYAGFFLTGEGQAGTYHPLHWFLYRCLPLRAALSWEYLATYPFMLSGTWLFLRRLLRRRDAAMVGSLLFGFCGFNLLHFVHPNAVAVVAHIPWLLWMIDIVLIDRDRRKPAWAQAGIALCTGSQLLLGYPQYVWFSLLTEGAYAGLLVWGPGEVRSPREGREVRARPSSRRSDDRLQGNPSWVDRTLARIGWAPCMVGSGPAHDEAGRAQGRWEPISRLIIAKGCGLLLGAVQLVPTCEALAQSARHTADATYCAWGSLHPLNLVQLVAPYLTTHRVLGQNTHEMGLYSGCVSLMLVLWLIASRHALGRLRWLAVGAGALAGLSLILAFGQYGWLYRLQCRLPLIGSFRFPCRYVVLFQFGMAVLAAIGFLLLVRDYRRSSGWQSDARPGLRAAQLSRLRRRGRVLWMAVGASVAVAIAFPALPHGWPVASLPKVWAGPLLLALAAGLVALGARGSRVGLVGLIVLAAFDLGVYGMSYGVYPSSRTLEEFVAGIVTPPAESNGRMMATPIAFDAPGLRMGDQVLMAGWSRADGYCGLEPRRELDYRRLASLRVAGVRWVQRSNETDRIEGLKTHDERWLEVPSPLPRVRLVAKAVPSSEPAKDIERIQVDSTALVEAPLALPRSVQGTATLVAERPGCLHVRCDCPSAQLLVVAESYHPGWRAIVDRKPACVWRVNGDFLGCVVGPGKQEVVLEFRPESLRRGWLASYWGIGLTLLCFAAFPIGRKRKRTADQRDGDDQR